MKNIVWFEYALKSGFWVLPYEFRRLAIKICHRRAFRHLQEMRHIDTDDGYSFKPFDQKRSIFIHIPKTAGISVCKSIFGNLAGGHRKLEIYQIAFDKHEFDDYFKFTFVRNPWDRLVSAYLFLKKGGMNPRDKRWAEQNLFSYVDFDSFVRNWVNRLNIETHIHFMPQFRFVCEPGQNKLKVDFVGYFENLEEDYSYVQKKLRVNTSLMHFNQTMDKKWNYREFYTDITKEIVAKVYQKDIRLFGYDFEATPLRDNHRDVAFDTQLVPGHGNK